VQAAVCGRVWKAGMYTDAVRRVCLIHVNIVRYPV
jgi:hypothetical protein